MGVEGERRRRNAAKAITKSRGRISKGTTSSGMGGSINRVHTKKNAVGVGGQESKRQRRKKIWVVSKEEIGVVNPSPKKS